MEEEEEAIIIKIKTRTITNKEEEEVVTDKGTTINIPRITNRILQIKGTNTVEIKIITTTIIKETRKTTTSIRKMCKVMDSTKETIKIKIKKCSISGPIIKLINTNSTVNNNKGIIKINSFICPVRRTKIKGIRIIRLKMLPTDSLIKIIRL